MWKRVKWLLAAKMVKWALTLTEGDICEEGVRHFCLLSQTMIPESEARRLRLVEASYYSEPNALFDELPGKESDTAELRVNLPRGEWRKCP
jgi:hypothetical protein